jgi:type IV pilus assembly protein PilQ
MRPVFGATLAVGLASTATAAELNVVRNLELSRDGAQATVSIGGSRAPVFTVFRMESPARLVVDIAGADISAVKGMRGGQGPVKQLEASQFADGKSSVGRVVLSLADGARYDVKASGDRLLIQVADASGPEPLVKLETQPEIKVAASAVAAEGADPHVLATRSDTLDVANPATRVTGVKWAGKKTSPRLEIQTDGQVASYTVTDLQDPPRLAIDLVGVKDHAKLSLASQGPIKGIRVGKQPDGLRLVMDASATTEGSYKLERTKSGLAITFGAHATEKSAAVQAAAEPKSDAKPDLKAEAKVNLVAVKDVKFKGEDGNAHVQIALAGPASYELTHPDPRTAVLTLHRASLPKELERSLDTAAFGGPVKMVSSFNAEGVPGDIQIVATLDSDVQDEVKTTAKGLRWNFKSTDDSEMLIDGVKVQLDDSRALGFQAEGPGYALSTAPRKPKYNGRRVSFEFKDIDLHNLLRIIAEVSKKNIIIGDDIGGKVTIRLRNVPWDQALDVILKTKGLDKDESGNIIRIVKSEQLAAERKADAERTALAKDTEEPKLRLIPVNYAEASAIADKVKDILSKKGSVTVDNRTNVLIVKDVTASLSRIEGLVRSLDLQTPQVMIEARIVEANSNFAHELGVQWGGQIGLTPALGNSTGLIFPSSAIVTGATDSSSSPGVSAIPNFAIDLPASSGLGKGGGLGFVFGSAGGAAQLNLRITAQESSGTAKTISAPKVTTLDNQAATISQGVAIPFSQFSASGTNTSFVEAKLELRVTPHVTQDGSVLLQIDATNNSPNAGFTGSGGQPSISKKEAHTKVLVKDGDTTVIGGIYTRQTSQNEDGLPLLGKIPVLGYFFRHRAENDTRTELLIFVTPHIINRQQSVVASGPTASNP